MAEEVNVDDGTRLVQVFLSPRLDGIWKVRLDVEKNRYICDCPRFIATCKHTRFVLARLKNTGEITIEVPNPLAEIARRRPLTNEECNHIVLHYGTPEVL